MHHELSTDATASLRKIDAVVKNLDCMCGAGANGVTPFALCLKLADQTIDFSNFKQNIVDPACGKGSFMLAVIKRFIEAGCPIEQAVSNVTGIDSCESQCEHASVNIYRATGYTSIVECTDSLIKEFSMKFDVVIGNPPYQNKNQILWKDFAEKAVDLCNDNGYVAFVTPNSWASGSKDNIYTKLFLKYHVPVIDMNASQYFPQVGKDIGYWILQKSPSFNPTTTVYDDSGVPCAVDLKSVPFFIRKFNLISLSIFNKIHAKKSFWVEFVERKPKFAREFAFPKIRYNGGYKFGYRYDGNDYEYPSSPVVLSLDMTNYSLDAVKKLSELFNSPLYRFLWKIYGASDAGSFGWILRNMPKVSLNRSWTNQELYQHFGLTEDEIDYVESNVK